VEEPAQAPSSTPAQPGQPDKSALAGIAGKLGRMVDRAVGALPLHDTAVVTALHAPTSPALPASSASSASSAGAASSPSGGTPPAPPVAPVAPPPPPSNVAALASALGTTTDRAAALLQDSGGYGDVIRAAAGITSSSERASVLLAVLRQPDVSATDLAALFRVAGGITSDPSRRDVLKLGAERYSLAPMAVRRAYFAAVAGFTSTPERRDVLLAVLARSPDPEVVGAVIQSARAMPADPERRDVLMKVVERAGSAELLAQVVGATRELVSTPVRRDLLVKVLSRPGLPTSVLREVFTATTEIVGSPEKRDVLIYAAGHQRLDGAARQAYLAAANSIASSPERAEALSAILGGRGTAAATPAQSGSVSRSVHELVDNHGTWESDLHITGDHGRVVRLRARAVVRGSEPDDIRAIRRGGSLWVEETRNGRTRRADLAPAPGGGITRSYRVDGQARPFDAEAERWLASILREFTRASR
jgi:hypothetical protein